MFKIESYVTPILLSYVDKYVRDFKPADAQVSLWGGGVALHNLVLKGDVLQQEVALPFTLVSGRIHELLIQVPWTKIMSEPIVVTIDTIECVLSLNPPATPSTSEETSPPASSSTTQQSRKGPVVEAPPGYMQALVRRIVSNIALRVHHLIVKYVQDDVVLSLNVKHLAVDSAGADWQPAFADIDQVCPLIRRLVRLDDLTLCLDQSDADGKIRFFQEPLLYRCQLDLRVLTRLLSATTRRATSLDVQLRSGKLAWSVSNEQLTLLLRLIRERPEVPIKMTPPPRQSVIPTPPRATTANSAEPTRSESWSEWAWSWLPAWADREVGVEHAPAPPSPLPLTFNAYLDDVSLMFKVMEVEGRSRKRARAVLELCATHAALQASACSPTALRVRAGARDLVLRSHGKCVCGYVSYLTTHHEPTVFVQRARRGEAGPGGEAWTWPEQLLSENVAETGEAADDNVSAASAHPQRQSRVSEGDAGPSKDEKAPLPPEIKIQPELETSAESEAAPAPDPLWASMAPLVFVEFVHERSPHSPHVNPYDNPPKDFEYSDWVEQCSTSVVVEPLDVRVCMGLIHRVQFLQNIFSEQAQLVVEQPKRILTVEENEALNENLPQKRIEVQVRSVRVRMVPFNHTLAQRPTASPLVLEAELPSCHVLVTEPLYPHRVCSAACQLPADAGALWQAARRHLTLDAAAVQIRLSNSSGTESRACARVDVKLVTHELLHKIFFANRFSVELAYHLKIKEMSICGSSARLQAAWEVLQSLLHQRHSVLLKHTTLPKDALNDEDAVAIDVALEDFAVRGYITKNVNTHMISLQSAKATALHAPKGGEIRQAWLFSAPDVPSSAPYLRTALQWCAVPMDTSFDYCGVWTEPLAVSVDPLFISWLAYKPRVKSEASLAAALKTITPSQIALRRRTTTPPSSSGRGASRTSATGICAELVHVPSRSQGSGSEPSDRKETRILPIPKADKTQGTWMSAERLSSLHQRLRSMLLNVELGLALVYVTMSSVSALDCATLRDAMERHAAGSHRVLGICLGRLIMQSSTMTVGLWNQLRSDGPTYVQEKLKDDSFPWKIKLSDVSCYTLEVRAQPGVSDVLGQESSGASQHLKSKLRIPKIATRRTVLELVTTTITVTVVTKTTQYKVISRAEKARPQAESHEDKKTKYFRTGADFKPTTLKEFVRGPATRKRPNEESDRSELSTAQDTSGERITTKTGPVVSLGINLHADTPPIVIRLEQDQVHIVAAAIHCFEHILSLLKRPLQITVSQNAFSGTNIASSQKSLIRSVSEEDQSRSDNSDQEELIAIFESSAKYKRPMKTFFWFQWVVSRVTVVVASETVKLALVIDDVINSLDIQAEYNQFKIKIASVSLKYFKKGSEDEWTAGVIGGRVLEAREPSGAEEDAHFLAVTVTQAQIADLPASWKEELHPKLLERNQGVDYMWEVYATLAPLEAVLQPTIVESLTSLAREMAPRALCPLSAEINQNEPDWYWPYIYLNAGGIRVLVLGEQARAQSGLDDTIVFSVGKISVNPHPDNPVCRRAATSDGAWLAAGAGCEGRQYEIVVSSVSVQSSVFSNITAAEVASAESKKGTSSENPALKWSQRSVTPEMVPILHPVELSCIFAPALYVGGMLTCGPAVELNLVSDCSIELGVAQLVLARTLVQDFQEAMQDPRLVVCSAVVVEGVDKHGACPYTMFLLDNDSPSEMSFFENVGAENKSSILGFEYGRMASDSGVETVASSTRTKRSDDALRGSLSVVFIETPDASQFVEMFVTMGVIELVLYAADDGSDDVAALRPPRDPAHPAAPPAHAPTHMDMLQESTRQHSLRRMAEMSQSNRSLTEQARVAGGGRATLDLPALPMAQGTVPLLHVTLFQPNVYYWKRKTQKTLQLSLFNAWVALGRKDRPGGAMLLSAARGVADPTTDIPPTLATFKMVTPITSGSVSATASGRGSVRLDVERPVQLHVSTDRLLRIMAIVHLLEQNLTRPEIITCDDERPFLYKLKNDLVRSSIESVTVVTGQLSVCGSEGALGWDSASLQLCAGARPARLSVRALVTALLLSAGPPDHKRHVVLQPLILGMEGEAYWEAWRRAEGGWTARAPTIDVSVELDDITVDVRPAELAALSRLQHSIGELRNKRALIAETKGKRPHFSDMVNLNISQDELPKKQSSNTQATENKAEEILRNSSQETSQESFSDIDDADHFYKDDLRSGAFKILTGGQLPMAYQVMLNGDAVSWRYPHPRAITRLVAFPLPDQDKETECVLELYSSMLGQWEPHTYFKLPVGAPREMLLYVDPPETVFATLWRLRSCLDPEPKPPPYEFQMKKFMPRVDLLAAEESQEALGAKAAAQVTAEQLSGVVRVDSYFAPRLLPRSHAVLRLAALSLHLHNDLPPHDSNETYLEGYYVSKPLMKTHRVLTLTARRTTAHSLLGSPAGKLVVVDTNLSCDMVDCSTGTMEQIVEEFRLQSAVSARQEQPPVRARVVAAHVHAALQVPRLKTLHALAADWSAAYHQYIRGSASSDTKVMDSSHKSAEEVAMARAQALEGRVALWLHNSCACAVRVGQADTDELVPLGPGVHLAYRWRFPTAPKRLRFALIGPTADWKWSASIPFQGTHKLRIDSPDTEIGKQFPSGAQLHVRVEEAGACRYMHLSGRLVLANMLRTTLLYKVRSHTQDAPQWHTVGSGELDAESVGRSVICSADCDLVLKVKFKTHSSSWSGDIPLKECPKENVPWLVKVPTEGECQFVSVWCRVVRGRLDGRILATFWPLYVLRSHLTLDTDVLIATELSTLPEEPKTEKPGASLAAPSPPAAVDAPPSAGELAAPAPPAPPRRPAPLLQSSPGRGATTHLHAPGTTSARHSLSFQYKNIESPVTREAVPMHYGVTDTSVFDKRAPVCNIDDVINDITQWVKRSGSNADTSWPYSVVQKHWQGEWLPASLQPRCDVTVRYNAVRAGGGCSLEIQLCPVVLLCNASPVSLTLRSYDAAPLCKLQAGTAIAPPTSIIHKPFYMSVEVGRETFVSSQLQVSAAEPGRYGAPPPGHVALGHAAHFAVLCNQKVALLTLYYEIKEHINVLGVSSSYVLINRLDTDLLISPIVVPDDMEEWITLRPKTYKVVPPTKGGSGPGVGTALCKFWLRGRWRGGHPGELRAYLCVSLAGAAQATRLAAPLRLAHPPLRRALALLDASLNSVPVVVTQMKQDGRWVVVVAPDPCPQFVVHNHTRLTLCVAQPVRAADQPATAHTQAMTECAGIQWWCEVPAGAAVHYSTPAHCARFPPTAMPPPSAPEPMLTFARGKDANEREWCAAVVAADGEQLLQYFGGLTIKLRVRTHPHSTLLDLQDVDENDISASDIRRRLMGVLKKEKSVETEKHELRTSSDISLLRTEQRTDETSRSPPPTSPERTHAASVDIAQPLSSLQKSSFDGRPASSTGRMIKRATAIRFSTDTSAYGVTEPDSDDEDDTYSESERLRCVIAGVALQVSAASDVPPLLALHLDRTALLVQADDKQTKTTVSVADAQVDNMQYESGQFDFGVVASTRAAALERDAWPPTWNMFAERDAFATRARAASLLLRVTHDYWEVVSYRYSEVTELEVRLGTLALYVEDAYVKALAQLARLLLPAGAHDAALAEERALQRPLRLRLLHLHPLDLTLTLHTAVRMYIALDQSPLRLSAFKLHDMMTSSERLTHALTVHYLSAAILGAGWVVGGLELLGAPGALAARVGGARGGVRGVASAAAAALLRSLSACAGSLARNLDLLAGDEEHARRAAAARRRPPPSLVAGLVAGFTNFAINILGAVGGLAHHPLVGVAVGESGGAAALRRGLLGALAKPLSATADLVAYAGSGLLRQAGWDPVPEPRFQRPAIEPRTSAGWQRDCVRWMFRLAELTALAGFEVLLGSTQLQLLLTHKFLVMAEPESERIVEMIDFRYCTLGPYEGSIVELVVLQKRQTNIPETRVDEDDEYQMSAAAMARVARYTGAEGGPAEQARVLALLPAPGRSHALHAALAAALRHNADTHFPLL